MGIEKYIKKIPFVKTAFLFFLQKVKRPFDIITIGIYSTFRTLKYSGLRKNMEGWKASLRVSCHIIEKGLTMPDRRFGFGQDRVQLICNEILAHSTDKIPEIQMAIGIIKEYNRLHQSEGFNLPVNVQNLINKVEKAYPEVNCLTQLNLSKDEFFSTKNSSFDHFAESRHSVRTFSNPASVEQINNAIKLAATAPSACNRQAVKCHIFSENTIVKDILSLQNGNRGFGHLVPQICILTVDLRMIGQNEQNDAFFNAGIYAMNLSYAFHYNEIGSCILNWSVLPRRDKALRKVVNIPKPESIVAIIAFGKIYENLEIARSIKKGVTETVEYH